MKQKKELSTRGKFGIVPSLILTIPFFILLIVTGFALWLLAKIFNFCGITDAIEWQLQKFDEGILKGRRGITTTINR